MGVPSLQALSGGGGLCFGHTFVRGGLENYLVGGGGWTQGSRGLGGCSVLRFTSGFFLDFIDVDDEKIAILKLQVCHAMLCSVVVRCGLIKCKVAWCAVLQSVVVCDLLWCVVLCSGVVCCVVV